MAVVILTRENESIGSVSEDNNLSCISVGESEPAASRAKDNTNQTVKRGRGRPRKNPNPSQRPASNLPPGAGPAMDAQESQQPPVKRGRGRPRKVPVQPGPGDSTAPVAPKRGRGRPRKVPINTDPIGTGDQLLPGTEGSDGEINSGELSKAPATDKDVATTDIHPPAVESWSGSIPTAIKHKNPVGRPPKLASLTRPAIGMSLAASLPLVESSATAADLDSPLPQFARPEAVLASPATLDKAGWMQLELKYVESPEGKKSSLSEVHLPADKPDTDQPIVKRKRGRPRKNPLPPPSSAPPSAPPSGGTTEPVVKKKRGRPRKNPVPPVDAEASESSTTRPADSNGGQDQKRQDVEPQAVSAPTGVKRKRGRPKKVKPPKDFSPPKRAKAVDNTESKNYFVLRFSESDSEGSDEEKTKMEALADRVKTVQERGQSPLLESTFQESYDEDSDN